MLLVDGERVRVEGDADVGVTEALLHDLVVADDDAADGLGGVPQSLRCDSRNSSLGGEAVHEPAQVLRVEPSAEGWW